MKKFYVKDCPESLTISQWLKNQTDWIQLMQSVKPRTKYPSILVFKIKDFNPILLEESIMEATKIYGDHGWQSSDGNDPSYTGFSLVYNPNHQDGLNIHASTLGTPKNNKQEFFWNTVKNHDSLRNSYYDSYGFNTPTPASQHGELGKFLLRSKCTRVRSRLSIINGHTFNDPDNKRNRWHKDEPIFENLRINIPITTSKDYFFQLENKEPVHLPVGRAYSWNTHIAHNVFNSAQNEVRRIHLVLGFSPWWNYNAEDESWSQNEFYGVKHPYDMLADCDVMDELTLDTDTIIYD
jgi:hypothetical protein